LKIIIIKMININEYELFIFDLDDTLIKTETYHYQSWLSILKKYKGDNFYIDFSNFCSKFHSNKSDAIKKYIQNELIIDDYEKLIKEKNELYMKNINNNKNEIELLDGCHLFIEELIKCDKKFVIVSNSPKIQIDFFCELFPILQKSTKNYYREMFTNKKPNPECYLSVICDFPNMKMIGFEDSITGIHAITTVDTIDTVFINTSEYYYYDYIIENYKLKHVINNYNNIFE